MHIIDERIKNITKQQPSFEAIFKTYGAIIESACALLLFKLEKRKIWRIFNNKKKIIWLEPSNMTATYR